MYLTALDSVSISYSPFIIHSGALLNLGNSQPVFFFSYYLYISFFLVWFFLFPSCYETWTRLQSPPDSTSNISLGFIIASAYCRSTRVSKRILSG